MADTGRPGAFIWYELMTDDIAAARDFYRAVVGWEIAEEGQPLPDGGSYHMITRSDGGHAGGVLAMSDAMAAGGSRPVWLGYIHHANVDAAVDAITRAGGTLHMPIADMPGVGRMAMVADPQGATVYIMAPTPPEGDPDAASDVFSVDRPQHIRWNELNTTDPDAAIAFYADLVGWGQEGAMDMGPLGSYRFVQHGDTTIGAVMRMVPQQPQPAWIFYAGVEDIDRAFAAATAAGAQVLAPPMEIPGGEFSATLIDPQGAAIGLVGPRRE